MNELRNRLDTIKKKNITSDGDDDDNNTEMGW